jgi:putative holliday junction resolvase
VSLLGIDYGVRRVGLAVSDPADIVAMPLAVIDRQVDRDLVAAVAERVAATGATAIVVGLPLNMNGTRGPMAEAAENFAATLRAALAIPVATYDERLSSCEVERVLLDADLSRRRRRDVRDKLAAQVILQAYLDRRAAPSAFEPDDDDGAPCNVTG